MRSGYLPTSPHYLFRLGEEALSLMFASLGQVALGSVMCSTTHSGE